MTYEIDEEKLQSVNKKDNVVITFVKKIDNFLDDVGKVLKTILIIVLVLSVIVFIGGSLLGILLFGWRQL